MMDTIIPNIKDPTLAETIQHGVAYYHTGLTLSDQKLIEVLYQTRKISILVCTFDTCWAVVSPAHLVIIMDTVYYEGKEHRYTDYSISDILQMVGTAAHPVSLQSTAATATNTNTNQVTTSNRNTGKTNTIIHQNNKAIIFCQTSKRENLRKLVYESLPIESHIDQFLHDHICAEIVSRTIENKQDAVDYLTWTFFYRRIVQNPNYYHLQGTTHRHVSDHLSELIENVISDLAESKCLAIDDDFDLSPLNIGTIASYYYIQYSTIELYSSSITEKTKIKGLLEVISASSEFQNIPIRISEDTILSKLSKHLPHAIPEALNNKYDDPALKALILLQLYFSRSYLPPDLLADLKLILSHSIKLIQSIVDVIASQGWLKPALAAMELSQMIVQSLWTKDSILMQLPHINTDIINRCKKHQPSPIENIFDIMELEDSDRDTIFQLSKEQLSDVAVFCNAYPNIEINYKLMNIQTDTEDQYQVMTEDSIQMEVIIKRDVDDDDEDEDVTVAAPLGQVVCPRFLQINNTMKTKMESWWVVIGDRNNNTMMSIKRVAVNKVYKVSQERSLFRSAL